MIISKNTIDIIKKHNACKDGIKWAESNIGADINTAPAKYFLWFVGVCNKEIPKGYKKFFNLCAKKEPWDALACASSLLTAGLLEQCARKEPWTALQYAASLLPTDLLKWCAEKDTWSALGYASSLLPPDLLKWCAEKNPVAALLHASSLLPPDLLKWCAENRYA